MRRETVGKRLEFARVAAGLTLGQAVRALAIHTGGRIYLTRAELGQWEQLVAELGRLETFPWYGKHFPYVLGYDGVRDAIAGLSELYDVSVDWILGTAPPLELDASVAARVEGLPDGEREKLVDLLDMLLAGRQEVDRG